MKWRPPERPPQAHTGSYPTLPSGCHMLMRFWWSYRRALATRWQATSPSLGLTYALHELLGGQAHSWRPCDAFQIASAGPLPSIMNANSSPATQCLWSSLCASELHAMPTPASSAKC